MGLMQGKVVGNSIVIMDSFALPVQGTETRVNAANEANEYMVEYLESSKKVRIFFTPWRSPCQLYLSLGWTIGECHRMVSLSSRIRLLVIWDRC
jgi:hypothetical protein